MERQANADAEVVLAVVGDLEAAEPRPLLGLFDPPEAGIRLDPEDEVLERKVPTKQEAAPEPVGVLVPLLRRRPGLHLVRRRCPSP